MRFQGVSPEELQRGGEESREQFIARVVQAIESHPDNRRLIAALEESRNNQYTPFSEQSKDMIHSSDFVDLSYVSCPERSQCPHCMRYSVERLVYCNCGTGLIPSEQVRRLKRKRFDVPTTPFFTIKKEDTHRGYRCDQSEGQSYHQAKVAARSARTKKFLSIQDGFIEKASYRGSQMAIGSTEETCLRKDALAAEDHSCCCDAC